MTDTAEPPVLKSSVAPGRRQVAGRAAAYAGLNALPRAIGFLMLPIYTHILGPAEYGRMSIAMAIFTIATLIMTAGLELAVFRSWFRLAGDRQAQLEFIHSTWVFLIVFPFCLATVLGAGSLLTGGAFTLTGPELALTFFAAAAQIASTTVPNSVARAQEDLRKYALLSTTTTVPMVGFAVLFVVAFRWGVEGWIGSIIVAQLIALACSLFIVPWQRGVRVARKPIAESIRFGIPMVAHYSFGWALNLSDRLILTGLVTASAIGVYSLGANLAMPVMVLVMAIHQACAPAYARHGADRNSEGALARTVQAQVAAVAWVAVSAALLGPPLVGIMAPPEFGQAREVVVWIALAYGILGLNLVPTSLATLTGSRNGMMWAATACGAAVDVILLLLWVPSGGIRAAAIATAVGYGTVFIGLCTFWRLVRGDIKVPVKWNRIAMTLATAAGAFAIAAPLIPEVGLGALACRAAVALGVGAAIFLIVIGNVRDLPGNSRLERPRKS